MISEVKVSVCPGTLAEGYTTYSPTCIKNVFGGKKVSHILPFASSSFNEESAKAFIDNKERLSISGAQEKLSVIQEGTNLRLTKFGEQGTHILKPIPRDVLKVDQVPANEHLTMQIARQVYGINTAPNALIFFADGKPAYITKRFDLKPDGTKWAKEDFASLAGKTTQNGGSAFKYDYSYEGIGLLMKQYVPAFRVEIEKYYVQVVFNYLFSNGDAHLKNFGLLETVNGDYVLSPAYDLMNTHIHVQDSPFALGKGLFVDGYKSDRYKISSRPGKEDFVAFGHKIGVASARVEKLLEPYLTKQPLVETLIGHSFLDVKTKRAFWHEYLARRNDLNS
jgi:serine/threonine-protein kinase HipA